MKKAIDTLAVLALILLFMALGCGYTPSPSAPELPHSVGYGGPAEDLTRPTVVFLGDSVLGAWLTPAVLSAHPSWTSQASPQGVEETTAQILAREPAALALQPNILVIQAGTWSMGVTYEGDFMCTWPSTEADSPCDDITSMVQLAQQAGMYVIVCSIPPWGYGPLQEQIDAADPTLEQNISQGAWGRFNFAIENASYMVESSAMVDFYRLLGELEPEGDPYEASENSYVYQTQYTVDGVNPDSQAGAAMVTAVEQAIAASGKGEAR